MEKVGLTTSIIRREENPKALLNALVQRTLKTSVFYLTRWGNSNGVSGYVSEALINGKSLKIGIPCKSPAAAEEQVAGMVMNDLRKYDNDLKRMLKAIEDEKSVIGNSIGKDIKQKLSIDDSRNSPNASASTSINEEEQWVKIYIDNDDITESAKTEDWISKLNICTQRLQISPFEYNIMSDPDCPHANLSFIGYARNNVLKIAILLRQSQPNKTHTKRIIAKKCYDILNKSDKVKSQILVASTSNATETQIIQEDNDPQLFNTYGTRTMPRDYQVSALMDFQKNDIYVPLPTGLGKTLIAALCTASYAKSQASKKGSHGLVAFITDRLTLVDQQAKYLARETGLKIAIIRGGTSVSKYDLRDVDILVCIAQSFLNRISDGVIPIERIGMIIIDEAHHADLEHPFTKVLNIAIKESEKGHNIRKLLLSATPVEAGNATLMIAKLGALLYKTDIKLHITDLMEVQRKYGSILKKEVVVYYKQPLTYKLLYQVREHIYQTLLNEEKPEEQREKIRETIEKIEAIGNSTYDNGTEEYSEEQRAVQLVSPYLRQLMDRMIVELTTPTNWDSVRHFIREYFQQFAMNAPTNDMFEYLQQVVDNYADEFERLYAERGELVWEDEFNEEGEDISHFSVMPDRERGVWYHIESHIREWILQNNGRIPKMLILAKTRWHAVYITFMFSKMTEGIANRPLNAAYLIGHNDVDAYAMDYKEQVRSAKSFKDGDVDVLVATTVVEEGFDVTECNIVYKIDVPYSLVSYVQSRGRVRKADGQYVMLVDGEASYRLQDLMKKEVYIANTLTVLDTHTIHNYSILALLETDTLITIGKYNQRILRDIAEASMMNPIGKLLELKQWVENLKIRMNVEIGSNHSTWDINCNLFTGYVSINGKEYVTSSGNKAKEAQHAAALAFMALPNSMNIILDIIREQVKGKTVLL